MFAWLLYYNLYLLFIYYLCGGRGLWQPQWDHGPAPTTPPRRAGRPAAQRSVLPVQPAGGHHQHQVPPAPLCCSEVHCFLQVCDPGLGGALQPQRSHHRVLRLLPAGGVGEVNFSALIQIWQNWDLVKLGREIRWEFFIGNFFLLK